MARRILPGLRGLQTNTIEPAPAARAEVIAPERKDLLSGAYYSSTLSFASGSITYGLEDRAAGYSLNAAVIDGYERDVWVYKCIEWMSNQQSRLPFRIGRHFGTKDQEVLDDHPLYRVLNIQANPAETGRQFRKRLSAQLLLSKRGVFVEVTKSNAGTITRLDLLPPDRVRPVPDPRGDYIDYFEFWTRYGGLREIDPSRIRWIRDPHPTDPFCGTTPLDPSGMSIELSHLSRLYNVQFIKNDGRPGGIVGVDTDGLDDQELDRIERRIGAGPQEAGKIAVVGTGQGGIKYVDTTTRPRDMAYKDSSENAKIETISAFGLAESLFGQSKGGTYDNVEQDEYNAWVQSELPHCDIVASGFVVDCDDDFLPFIDTSSVDCLELPQRKRREEARQEFQNGLRSANEYRPLADLDELDNAYAYALWMSPAKAPIPGRPQDAAALGVGAGGPGQMPGAPGAGGMPPGTPPGPAGPAVAPAAAPAPGQSATDAVAEARGQQTEQAPAQAAVADASQPEQAPTTGEAADTVAEARAATAATSEDSGEAAAVVDEARKRKLEGKAFPTEDDASAAADPANDPAEYVQDPNDQARVEAATAAALDSILARQSGVITARLESPKARKGTKFWTADNPTDTRAGDQPVDTGKVIDSDRWVSETTETLSPIVSNATADSSHRLLDAFMLAGIVSAAGGGDDEHSVAGVAGQAAVKIALGVLTMAAQAMGSWLAKVDQTITAAADAHDSIDQLTAAVRDLYHVDAPKFAKSLAVSIASASVQGAADAAAHILTPLPGSGGDGAVSDQGIYRAWVTMHDERVRPSHDEADGQVQELGAPFHVGNAELMYPGDPAGPPAEIRWCRCHLRYAAHPDSRFLLPPPVKES